MWPDYVLLWLKLVHIVWPNQYQALFKEGWNESVISRELLWGLSILQGVFGDGCNEICFCMNGGSCHHITGECICPPGVSGKQCEDGCPPGYYGMNCDKQCTKACSSGFCDRTYGFCQCQPGYFGVSCEHRCSANTWGPNCREMWVRNQAP